MAPLNSEELQRLGKELLEDPTSNMNHILPLMKALNTEQPKVIVRFCSWLHAVALYTNMHAGEYCRPVNYFFLYSGFCNRSCARLEDIFLGCL